MKWPRLRFDFGGGSLSEGSNEATGDGELGEPSDEALAGELVPGGILNALKLEFPGHGPNLEQMQQPEESIEVDEVRHYGAPPLGGAEVSNFQSQPYGRKGLTRLD